MNKTIQSNTVFISSTVRELGLLARGQLQPVSSFTLHGDTEGRAVAGDRVPGQGWDFHEEKRRGGKEERRKRESVASLLPIREETCGLLGPIQTPQKF